MSRTRSIAEKVADHLLRKTLRTELGCLVWTGAVDLGGYGKMAFEHGPRRMQLRAHRAAFEQANGPIPAGQYVCHACDVKTCCEPSHLFLGDARVNNADMAAKGRRRNPGCSERQAEIEALVRARVPPHQIRKRLGVPQSDIYRRAAELWFAQEPPLRAQYKPADAPDAATPTNPPPDAPQPASDDPDAITRSDTGGVK